MERFGEGEEWVTVITVINLGTRISFMEITDHRTDHRSATAL